MGGEKHSLLRCIELFNESDYIPGYKDTVYCKGRNSLLLHGPRKIGINKTELKGG